ncbi:AAA family ATPase [Brachybacterium sp. AOP43-C2-M15]|uniref:AAA family ATPase n=1 Tax=Brachybacterium sp. AOP43-C2-M15 TaxID=3457661 RepID=UPI004033F319
MQSSLADRARRAASTLARSFGLAVDEVVDLHDSNRLTVLLLPCELVARIAPAGAEGAQDEIDRALRLEHAGAPVGGPDPRVPAQVHLRDGLEITLWTHHAPRTDRELPPTDYAAGLARLHAAMRSARFEAPPFTTRVDAALALLEDPRRTPRLTEPDRAFLRTTLTTLAAQVSRRGDQQPLHGEPHPGNVLDTAHGPVVIDLETCCTGPVEFDLAHAPVQVAVHYPAVDAELLEDCRILTRALATTWRWDREDSLPNGELLGIGWLDQVRALMERRRRPATARPTLTILHGLPGSGRTAAAAAIIEAPGAVRLSADDWMARLGRSPEDEDLRDRIEHVQWQIGRELLELGVSTVVVWSSWGRDERDRLREEARALGARVALHDLDLLPERTAAGMLPECPPS